MQLQQDTLFDNRYTLRQLIGRGGFSEVWLAHDTWTELDIAIKVYAPGQGMDTNGLQIFSKELAGVFNLNQANLLKPTHVGQWLNMPYLIMEYCPKGALNKQVGKLTEQEVWKVLHDVAAGLAYLHAKEIVHQDIKPDNILLDENGVYRITDFGISTKARTTLRRSIGAAAVSGGTTAYMAPERFSANPAPTKASDIWSLGAMVFELITGDVPFGEIGGGLQKNGADIPTIHPAKGVLSAELTHVVRLMLAPNAWDRPTADTLAAWASNPLTLNFAADSSNVSTPKAGANEGQKAGGTRETTILKLGSSSGNDTTSRPTPHEPNPTGVHPQPQKDEKKGRHLWLCFLGIIAAVLIVVCSIAAYQKKQEIIREQAIVERLNSKHEEAVSNFEKHLQGADIDHIVNLENALNDLSQIGEIEKNSYFRGYPVFSKKKQELKQTAETLYNTADGKSQRAPLGSAAETKAKEKAKQINNNVLQKL